jgi:transposase
VSFLEAFPDDEFCAEHLWRTRYAPDGEHAECPKCKCVRRFKRYATSQGRKSWTCIGCGHHVHPKAGTIFHRSSAPLQCWFEAIWRASHGDAVSARALERKYGVTYKAAWRIRQIVTKLNDPKALADTFAISAFQT